MKHLELHILQSVPVACLNRDDLNSPKTAIFGGVQRARVSSQSWKRAIRELAKETDKDHFKGERTRYIIKPIIEALKLKLGKEDPDATNLGQEIAAALATKDKEDRVKTLLFSTPLEIEAFAAAYVNATSPSARKKAIEGLIGKSPLDAADIAIFGRMVASDYTARLEGAAMFSHALSVHKVDNEIDFFSAVDDSPDAKNDPGAAHTSTLEFNSATYYRFAALNLDMLADEVHLKALSQDERRSVVRTFVESTIKAIPGARKNTMNGNTLPIYVLAVVRAKGHPIQLVNAFENPIRPNQGYGTRAVELLKAEYARLKEIWGVEAAFEKAVPEVGLKELLDGLVAHVN
jgi:CRISPR system Cascade subunit CasC